LSSATCKEYTFKQVLDMLDISEPTLYSKLVQLGIRGKKITNTLFLTQDDVDKIKQSLYRTCIVCGKGFYIKNIRRVFCSPECRYLHAYKAKVSRKQKKKNNKLFTEKFKELWDDIFNKRVSLDIL